MALTRQRFIGALLGCAVAAAFTPADAQDWPAQQPIRWIVPFPAGGGTDVVARLLATAMSPALGQTLVIENKPGGGTMIAGEALARARPDGYTIGTVDVSTVALAPHLYSKVPYRPERDFAYLGGTTRFPFVLVANPSVKADDLAGLLALAKARPGELKVGSPGLGGPNHLGLEVLQRSAGVQLLHVPYKGDAPALQDLMGGQIDLYLGNTAATLPYLKSGKLKPIALSMPERSAVLPEVPTFAEAGLPGFESYAWQGLAAPAGTPPAIVERLNAALNRALAAPEVKQKLAEMGIEPLPSTPAAFTALVAAQSERWGGVIRAANIRLEP